MAFTTTNWGPVTTRSHPYPTIPAGQIGITICTKWIGSESNCIETLYLCDIPPTPTAAGSDKGEKDLERAAFVSSTPTGTTTATTPTNSGTSISKSSSADTNTSKATSTTTTTTTGKPTPTQKSGAIQLSKSGFTILAMLFVATILAN